MVIVGGIARKIPIFDEIAAVQNQVVGHDNELITSNNVVSTINLLKSSVIVSYFLAKMTVINIIGLNRKLYNRCPKLDIKERCGYI